MKSTNRTADLLFILSLRPPFKKHSLRRAASAELLKSRSRSARFGDRLSFLRPIWHNDLLFLIALLFIAIVVLTLPLSSLELRRLSAPEDAEGFLRSLWQVVAVALALSVAVILFLFQAVATSQPGGSLREFAEDSHLLKFLDLGVVALLILGLTLLGVGSGAPGGWAAAWASFFAGAAILLLPVLFRSSLHAVSDERLHTRRLARLRKRAEQSVEIDAHTGIAYQLLDEFCRTEGIELEPVFATPPDGSKRLTSWRPGQIGDVNLRLLRAMAKKVKAGGSVTLTVYPGSKVGVNGLLGYFSTPTTTAAFRLAPRLFRIGPRHRDEIVEAIEQVHNEALKAIGNSDPLSFERTTEIYQEIISAFADSWYRHRKTISHPPSGFGLVEGPTRRLTRKLYEELHLAMRSESREIMFEATSLPNSISTIGIERGNVDLARQAFRLAIEMYRLVKKLPATEISEIALERSWLLLLEHIEYKIAFPISNSDTSLDEKRHLLPFAHLGFGYIAELLKIMVDHEDLSTVRQVDARWVDFFKHWFPEQARPRDFDVTALEDQHGADDHRVIAASDQAEKNKLLAEQKQALLGTRNQLHFSLAFGHCIDFGVRLRKRHLRESSDTSFLTSGP